MSAEYTPTTKELKIAWMAPSRSAKSTRVVSAEFDRWLERHDRGVAAHALRDVATEISSHYPIDFWPKVTDEEMKALHEFAETLGMADGSRFHVGGIRHAVGLVRSEAARIEEES